jgi:hypothetical protein
MFGTARPPETDGSRSIADATLGTWPAQGSGAPKEVNAQS